MEQSNYEQILVRITGQDRPGLTAAIMGILSKYDAQILDIGQADITPRCRWEFSSVWTRHTPDR